MNNHYENEFIKTVNDCFINILQTSLLRNTRKFLKMLQKASNEMMNEARNNLTLLGKKPKSLSQKKQNKVSPIFHGQAVHTDLPQSELLHFQEQKVVVHIVLVAMVEEVIVVKNLNDSGPGLAS
jgi:hypothetical protein